ncbi:MAG: glycosyltransferase, partial [Paludibacteraceae bacterium]|nr:glycosyltransferase [Paludibacteraceae bacterium]
MTDSNIESIAKAQELGIVTIIPTYNNAKTLSTIIDNVLLFCKDVIVVNDGSTDETSDILSKKSGFTLISYEKNRGKGHALKLG